MHNYSMCFSGLWGFFFSQMNGLKINVSVVNNIDKASNKTHPKAEKGISRASKRGIFALGHNELMKKQTMDFTLGTEILK